MRMRLLGLLGVLMVLFAAPASATVLNFDDLSGSGTLADGYGGINWGGVWNYYSDTQDPYNPSSPPERIYATLGVSNASFTFEHPSYFSGAYFAGYSSDTGPMSFNLYLNNVLVGTSGTLDPSNIPTFLASSYAGLVDKVVVLADANFYIMDDLTFTPSAVPLPAALPLFGAALAGLGAVGRKARRKLA